MKIVIMGIGGWTDCGAEVGSKDARTRPDFIVRLAPGGQIAKVGPVSPEAMGRAFMDRTGYGFMVDAYYGAIHQLTLSYPIASEGQVLGYTIAHELGHLLIGPGHRPEGIMRASWGRNEVDAIFHRFLYFNKAESILIVRKLRMRRSSSSAIP